MSSRMQDVISQQAGEKSREHILTTTRESGICTQILQQQTNLHLIQEAFDAEAELGMEEAVFYQNGDWEYAAFAPDNEKGYTVKQEDLSMMPIYFGVDDANEGLAVGTENHWAVNAKSGSEKYRCYT